jgi:hypothetical protein
VHSGVQTSGDILPVDIETVVNKIFQYFHIYTIRVKELKEFRTFVDTEYKQVLGSVKTRWLSLELAVDRVIEMYEGLKSYSLSQDRCSALLKNFFLIILSLCSGFLFIQLQFKTFCKTIKKLKVKIYQQVK